jgi:TRAP-type C4-dicarboxylate transport system substrate-binding protein
MNPIEIRFGGYQPPASVHSRAAARFGETLAATLGDSVHFRLAGNVIAEGRKATDLLSMVASGELTMCYFAASYLSDLVPELALFDLPFVVGDRETAYAALDGPLGSQLQEGMLAASGYRILGFWDNGFRHLTNRVQPIRRPEDCRGLSIRTLASELHTRTFRQLGFEPTVLDVKDLLAGVAAGTIDAQENPLTNNWNFGFQNFQPYWTLTGHFFGVALWLCHEASWQAWPAGVRAAVEAAVPATVAAQRGFAEAEDADVLAKLAGSPVDPVRLTPAERSAFADTVRPIVDAERARLGEDLFALLR